MTKDCNWKISNSHDIRPETFTNSFVFTFSTISQIFHSDLSKQIIITEQQTSRGRSKWERGFLTESVRTMTYAYLISHTRIYMSRFREWLATNGYPASLLLLPIQNVLSIVYHLEITHPLFILKQRPLDTGIDF